MNEEIPSTIKAAVDASLAGKNANKTDMMSVYYLYALPMQLSTETIVNLLPDGLDPGPPTARSGTTHLSFFIFGAQKDVKLEVSPFGIDYMEASFAIPALTYDNGNQLYSYWVKLFCTSPFATDMGQRLGYPKFLSSFEENGDTVCITCTTNGQKEVMTAAIGTECEPRGLDKFPILSDAKMSEEAFISFKNEKAYVSERVDSRYSYITPLSLSVDFANSGIEGINGVYSADPLKPDVMGAFRTVQAAEWRWPTAIESS